MKITDENENDYAQENSNDSDDTMFIENKLYELNNQEQNLLEQEKNLERESRELLEKTKQFLI